MRDFTIKPEIVWHLVAFPHLIMGGAIASVWWYVFPDFFLYTFFFAFAYVIALTFLSVQSLKATSYVIGNGKIEYTEGFLSRVKKSISIEKVTDIAIQQSVLERFSGIGTILFSTAGTLGYEVVFRYVDNHEALYEEIRRNLVKRKV